MKVDKSIFEHPKFLAFKHEVGAGALEYLCRLWGHAESVQRGEKWVNVSSKYIESICNWLGEPQKLYRALIRKYEGKSGWIQRAGRRTIIITNWSQYNIGLIANWNRNPKGRPNDMGHGEALGDAIASPPDAHGLPHGKPTGTPRGPLLYDMRGDEMSPPPGGVGGGGRSEVRVPNDEKEAVQMCVAIGVPERFLVDLFRELASKKFKDEQGRAVRNWVLYAKKVWERGSVPRAWKNGATLDDLRDEKRTLETALALEKDVKLQVEKMARLKELEQMIKRIGG